MAKILTRTDFTRACLKSEDFQKDVCDDLGDVELQPGMTIRGLLGTVLSMSGADKNEHLEYVKENMGAIYDAYLKACVKEGHITENEAIMFREGKSDPESEKEPEKIVDDPEPPKPERDPRDQYRGFGYPPDSTKGITFACCLKGMTPKDISEQHDFKGDVKEVYRVVSEIRKEMAEEGLKQTIYIDGDGKYRVGNEEKQVRDKKPPVLKLLDLLSECNGDVKYEINLDDDYIKIDLSGTVEIDRTKKAEDSVAAILLEQQFGISGRKVR